MKQGIMATSFLGVFVLCVTLVSTGCLGPGSGEGYRPDLADIPVIDGDEGSGTDAAGDDTVDRPDISPGSDSGLPFVPDPYIPASSVRFELVERDGDLFHINVIARSLGTIFGVALRVEWDASAFERVESKVQEVMGTEDSGIAIYRDGEVRPGSLAVAASHLTNLAETDLDGDVILATLSLRSLNGEPSRLSFFEPRCLVLTRRLDRVATTYHGANLVP